MASGTPDQKVAAAVWITGPLRTRAHVARRLGVSADTVTDYFDAGALHGIDMSPSGRRRMLRFSDDDIELFEERLKRERAVRRQRTRANGSRS